MTSSAAPYFAACQEVAQFSQFITDLDNLSVLKIEPLAKSHPIHNDPLAKPALVHFPVKSYQLYSITFSETPFFPNGGGQPADTGELRVSSGQNASIVTFPIIGAYREQDIITHVVVVPKSQQDFSSLVGVSDQPEQRAETDQTLSLHVDAQRRLFFMHQHTSQHLISSVANICFGLPTFGWKTAMYNADQVTPRAPIAGEAEYYSDLLSFIDFQGELVISVEKIIALFIEIDLKQPQGLPWPVQQVALLTVLQTLPLFNTQRFRAWLSKFSSFSQLSSQVRPLHQLIAGSNEQHSGLPDAGVDIPDWSEFVPYNNTPIQLYSPSTFFSDEKPVSFDRFIVFLQSMANVVIASGQHVQVEIQGQIVQEEGQHTSSTSTPSTGKGVTQTSVDVSEAILIRANEKKLTKYGGAPKRFISIGIEKAPCCGTHVSNLLQLQSISIFYTVKNGARHRLYFAPAVNAHVFQNWAWGQLLQLRQDMSCRLEEIVPTQQQRHAASLQSFQHINVLKDYLFQHHYVPSLFTLWNDVSSRQPQTSDNSTTAAATNAFPTIVADGIPIIHINTTLCTKINDIAAIVTEFRAQESAANDQTQKKSPLVFITSSIDNISLVAQTDTSTTQPSVIDPNSGVDSFSFYVHGGEQGKYPAYVKEFGLFLTKALETRGGGRPGVYQGKLLPNTVQTILQSCLQTLCGDAQLLFSSSCE